MDYYLATEIPNKPYIYFQTTSLTEGALVLPKANLPKPQFGVFPIKIVNGQLENRTPTEMAAFEAEYNLENPLRLYDVKAESLSTQTFAYKGSSYPMFLSARLYYSVMQQTPGDYAVRATTGMTNIAEASRLEFLTAYYTKLKELTQP
ncbi:hypothetical protein Q765_00160 [Flavobacterium rivuli WB 3.3-2 = DSM 21788]|uniref:Uncharacterized protein n=1 Tax=Flavobacterium rivuli WB 3.3-2 = DSM 21788 TaxID=1121895 RepID=A0A0A2MJ67_9FLAO|nr:hypothetical protein [Flavobacterium rivuli]KGO88370.1 hypothetical protein Q765_00160 [Flavobacterium rivuli WB 3.3-2 = DSM 21788]